MIQRAIVILLGLSTTAACVNVSQPVDPRPDQFQPSVNGSGFVTPVADTISSVGRPEEFVAFEPLTERVNRCLDDGTEIETGDPWTPIFYGPGGNTTNLTRFSEWRSKADAPLVNVDEVFDTGEFVVNQSQSMCRCAGSGPPNTYGGDVDLFVFTSTTGVPVDISVTWDASADANLDLILVDFNSDVIGAPYQVLRGNYDVSSSGMTTLEGLYLDRDHEYTLIVAGASCTSDPLFPLDYDVFVTPRDDRCDILNGHGPLESLETGFFNPIDITEGGDRAIDLVQDRSVLAPGGPTMCRCEYDTVGYRDNNWYNKVNYFSQRATRPFQFNWTGDIDYFTFTVEDLDAPEAVDIVLFNYETADLDLVVYPSFPYLSTPIRVSANHQSPDAPGNRPNSDDGDEIIERLLVDPGETYHVLVLGASCPENTEYALRIDVNETPCDIGNGFADFQYGEMGLYLNGPGEIIDRAIDLGELPAGSLIAPDSPTFCTSSARRLAAGLPTNEDYYPNEQTFAGFDLFRTADGVRDDYLQPMGDVDFYRFVPLFETNPNTGTPFIVITLDAPGFPDAQLGMQVFQELNGGTGLFGIGGRSQAPSTSPGGAPIAMSPIPHAFFLSYFTNEIVPPLFDRTPLAAGYFSNAAINYYVAVYCVNCPDDTAYTLQVTRQG